MINFEKWIYPAFTAALFTMACSKPPEQHSAPRPRCMGGFVGPVTFFDASGQAVKTIQFSVDDTKKPDADGLIPIHTVSPRGCRSGNFAAVIRESGRVGDESGEFEAAGELDFYGADGKIIWTKKMLPRKSFVSSTDSSIVMSKSDTRILYEAHGPAFVVLGADGSEKIFKFVGASLLWNMGVSDNGRFGVIHVGTRASESYFRFYDFETGKTHDFLNDKGNGLISDDGTAEVFIYPHPGTAEKKILHRYKFE